MITIVITPENDQKEIKILPLLFDKNLEILHIRKPDFSAHELKTYIKRIPAEFHNRLVIHSHHHLAGEFQLRGLHFPERRRGEVSGFSKIRSISSSFHSIPELKATSIPFDYVFLSPIFNSISKTGYQSPFDAGELMSEVPVIQQKVIALGGINELNVASLKEVGFAGAALLGAVWNSEDPVEKFSFIRSILLE